MARRAPSTPPRVPEVSEFRDYRSYIRAIFESRRAQGRRPGLVALAKAAGLSNGHLGNIVAGRRDLDPSAASELGLALGLEGERHRFFVLLVALEAARSPGARAAIRRELDLLGQSIGPRRRGRPSRAELDERARRLQATERGAYTRTWLNNALFSLLSCPRAPASARGLARLFRRRTTPTAVRASLADLQALGLIRPMGGRLLPTAELADAESPAPEPMSVSLIAGAWEMSRAALLERDAGAALTITLIWRCESEAEAQMRWHLAAFRERTLLSEADSALAGVTTLLPSLPPEQDPARVVVQHGLMTVPWLPDSGPEALVAQADVPEAQAGG